MRSPKLEILVGDNRELLRRMPDRSVHMGMTSPPYYGLRDYGVTGQIGLEATPEEFLAVMVDLFREFKRVLRDDGTLWVNMGDGYASSGGSGIQGTRGQRFNRRHTQETIDLGERRSWPLLGIKPKDMMGMPWRLAFALQAGFSACSGCGVERRSDLWPEWNGRRVCIDCLMAGNADARITLTEKGWYLRQEIIWHKPNPMPESVTDRCCKAHEQVFLLAKSPKYFYDAEAVKEPVSGTANARGSGVNAKIKVPEGWATGPGTHGTIHPEGRNQKGPRSKQNASFSGAVNELVSTLHKRSVWSIPTEACKEAHFATFPRDLVKPCILAGTSAAGCCAECGAPRVRYVESVTENRSNAALAGTTITGKGHPSNQVRLEHDVRNGPVTSVKTLYWLPTCQCDGRKWLKNGMPRRETRANGRARRLEKRLPEAVPCVVVDVFGGSCTTGEVASDLGRDSVMLELNPDYAAIGRRRTTKTMGFLF